MLNIAIQMEIKARELEGRSLLAMVAAERGHRVLLGDVRRHLRARPQDFPGGIFHDKSLTPSPDKRRFFTLLGEHGWTLTSQDEEHWLNLPDFEVPAVRRFSAETLTMAARSFAWGDHERDALQSRYPEQRASVVSTGSPRTDLWLPELRPYHAEPPLPGIAPGRPYVLFSSNFSFVLDVNPFWVRIRDKRRHYVGLDDAFEFDRYDAAADKQRVLRDFVRAVRHLAASRPDLLVVVRPHPIEAEGAWEDLLGPVPNVLVTRERTLNAWIRGAVAVVQNGCTSGYEAAVGDVPVISFHPRGILADYPVNMLGLRASSIEELDLQLDRVLADRERWTRHRDPGADALLRRRLTIGTGGLAAERIVDEWEGLDVAPARPLDITRILRGRRTVELRRRAGTLKRAAGGMLRGAAGREVGREVRAFRSDHKFPPIGAAEIERVVHGLRAVLGRFHDVDARVVAPDLVLFAARVDSGA